MEKINVTDLDFERLEPQISEAARLMEMLSHPARLRILCTLRDSELVNTRRDKQTIYYSLKGEHVAAVLEVLHGLYCSELIF
jgi:DNA-binding transcriptional ArsR family regulator